MSYSVQKWALPLLNGNPESTIADEAIRGEVTTRLIVLVLKYIFTDGLGGHLDEILQLASEVLLLHTYVPTREKQP